MGPTTTANVLSAPLGRPHFRTQESAGFVESRIPDVAGNTLANSRSQCALSAQRFQNQHHSLHSLSDTSRVPLSYDPTTNRLSQQTEYGRLSVEIENLKADIRILKNWVGTLEERMDDLLQHQGTALDDLSSSRSPLSEHAPQFTERPGPRGLRSKLTIKRQIDDGLGAGELPKPKKTKLTANSENDYQLPSPTRMFAVALKAPSRSNVSSSSRELYQIEKERVFRALPQPAEKPAWVKERIAKEEARRKRKLYFLTDEAMCERDRLRNQRAQRAIRKEVEKEETERKKNLTFRERVLEDVQRHPER